MTKIHIAPDAAAYPSGPHSSNAIAAPVVYKLAPLHELPIIDPTKAIKSLLFNKKQISVINCISYHSRKIFSVMTLCDDLLSFVEIAVSASLGRILAIPTVTFQLPSIFFIILGIRYEMVFLLIKTYDLWVFTTVNLAFCACYGVYLGDARIVVLIVTGYLIQISIVVDTQLGSLQAFVITAMLSVVCGMILMLMAITPRLRPVTCSSAV
uniref:Uncharacterized protein n=1 Tax=Globisporangium ultimum (strain ATCC 200006 / CBS 805.95 / DAOM BR144) TaxID=431595 RepID=K3WJ15_GLOUD